MIVFGTGSEFVQEVGVAATVTASKGVVGSPKVVKEDSSVIWQDIGGGEAFDTAFRTITFPYCASIVTSAALR